MTRRSNRHDACHDAPLQRRAQPRARAQSAGGRPGGRALRLQRHAAPTRTAHAAVAREALRRTLVHEMMSETHLPAPSPSAGARSAPCTKRLDRRKAHDVFDLPSIPRRQRAQPGEHMWALGRAAPTPLVPSAQREAATGLPYRRPGAQRPRHRRRARSARRRWQPAAAPPGAARHTGAQRRAPCAVRRAPSARRRSGSPQAPGAQRPRHRRRARSARRRQLRAGMLAQPAHGRHTDTLGGFCLLAHNSKIVGGLKTMSPAPGRRPPIYRVA